MTTFTDKLTELYTLSQMELAEHIIQVVAETGLYEPTIVMDGGLICFPKKEVPLILLSHLDTVSQVQPLKEDIEISGNIISLSKDSDPKVKCLGGDDRNGVHLMLEVVAQGITPTLIFPYDEEIGCVGTSSMINEISRDIEIFSRLQNNKLMVQIDRGVHGLGHVWDQEVVYYDESNKDFIQLMNCWFVEDMGSFTDVAEWSPFLGVSGCNIGAGYRNEHTRLEQTNITILKDQLRKLLQVIEITSEDDTPFYEHVACDKFGYEIYEDMDMYTYQYDGDDWVFEMSRDYVWSQERYDRVPMIHLDGDMLELNYYKSFVQEYYGNY